MGEQENRQELRGKLIRARDIEEVRAILGPETTEEEIGRVWREIQARRPADGLEELDDDEMEAVSGGASRNWEEEGCSSTMKKDEWCWFSDECSDVIITYSNYDPCTGGGHHKWKIKWDIVEYGPLVPKRRIIYVCEGCEKQKEDYYEV